MDKRPYSLVSLGNATKVVAGVGLNVVLRNDMGPWDAIRDFTGPDRIDIWIRIEYRGSPVSLTAEEKHDLAHEMANWIIETATDRLEQ